MKLTIQLKLHSRITFPATSHQIHAPLVCNIFSSSLNKNGKSNIVLEISEDYKFKNAS